MDSSAEPAPVGGLFDHLYDSGFESRAGFVAETRLIDLGMGGTRYTVLLAPCWSLAAAFSVAPPLWLLTRFRRARRQRARVCPGCGYDLRASPDRCPECGAENQAIISN